MSSIQHGIQAAHVIQAMYKKYSGTKTKDNRYDAFHIFDQWMKSDMTMIVLNGGNSASIKELMNMTLMTLAIDKKEKYPIASFFEDQQSMESMMTGWGIVLPKIDKKDFVLSDGIYYNNRGQVVVDSGTRIYLEVLSELRLAT